MCVVGSEGASVRGGGGCVERCQAMLHKLREVCPQLGTDGLNNIWIIKPGAMSRGRGEALDSSEVDNSTPPAFFSRYLESGLSVG